MTDIVTVTVTPLLMCTGQKFIESQVGKIRALKTMCLEKVRQRRRQQQQHWQQLRLWNAIGTLHIVHNSNTVVHLYCMLFCSELASPKHVLLLLVTCCCCC